jgi:hypothetical protein
MTARMFHLRLMEYQQLLVLLADNNMVDLAMKLFVGIVQMEAFRSESTMAMCCGGETCVSVSSSVLLVVDLGYVGCVASSQWTSIVVWSGRCCVGSCVNPKWMMPCRCYNNLALWASP